MSNNNGKKDDEKKGQSRFEYIYETAIRTDERLKAMAEANTIDDQERDKAYTLIKDEMENIKDKLDVMEKRLMITEKEGVKINTATRIAIFVVPVAVSIASLIVTIYKFIH